MAARRALPTLAAAALATLLVAVVWPGPSRAASGATLKLQTVPRLPGVGLNLDGTTYRTGATGSVTIDTGPGTHTVSLVPTTALPGGRTGRPDGWLGERGIPQQITLSPGLNVEHVSFIVSRPVTVTVTDQAGRPVPTSQIDSITLANSLGEQYTLKHGATQTVLPLNGVVHPRQGFVSVPVRYSVRSVIVQGGEVVHRGSQTFAANAPVPWVINALVFPLRIQAKDALFGFGIGESVVLAPRFGEKRTLTLGPGHDVLADGLARGTYDLTPHGPGYGFTSVTTLSRPQEAKVLLFSYVDMAVVVVFAALFVVGLPLLSGRLSHRGSRLLHWRERRVRQAAPVGEAAAVREVAPRASDAHAPTAGDVELRTAAPLEPSTQPADTHRRRAS